MPVEVVAYDARWPALADSARAELLSNVRRLVEALDGVVKTDAVSQHGGVLWLSATP